MILNEQVSRKVFNRPTWQNSIQNRMRPNILSPNELASVCESCACRNVSSIFDIHRRTLWNRPTAWQLWHPWANLSRLQYSLNRNVSANHARAEMSDFPMATLWSRYFIWQFLHPWNKPPRIQVSILVKASCKHCTG